MTKWKQKQTETLILMHAHNQWSRWNDAVLNACDSIGLPVGKRAFRNCSGDGSWDEEYYTLSASLDRIGGIEAVYKTADELFV